MEKSSATEMFEPPAWDERYSGDGKIWGGSPAPTPARRRQRPRTVSRDGETVEIDDSTLLARRG